jgi:signal transduction histidine kinase
VNLEHAFERFEQAARHLERRHDLLRDEVGRLEAQLTDANRRLEAVLDALDSGIAVLGPGGECLRTNRALDAMDVLGPDGTPGDPALAELVASEGRRSATVRLRRDGPHGPRDLVAIVIPVGDGAGTRVLSLKDVTDVRREEEEGGRRLRLESLGRMAAELAHEVRNPLGSIRLFASMLEEDLSEDRERRDMAAHILRAVAGLEGTVSNLLAFAAPARGASRAVDLAAIAREGCSLLAPSCSARGVRVESPADDASAILAGDPEGLRQVVLNLLGNALAATGPGGSIRVTVEDAGDRVRLEVTDDGRGIEPEDLPRVLEPFFSRTEGGTGLGLSIVHRTVERHGGRIRLDSRPGVGTTARIELPRSVVEGPPHDA